MELWESIINKMPNAYKELFYEEFNNEFKVCSSCNLTLPENTIFFRPNKYKGKIVFYTCRNCMENKKLDKYLLEGFKLQSLHKFFKDKLKGLKYCKSCDKFLEDTVDNFTYAGICLCRNCQGVERLETNYYENSLLIKKGFKKCKYCNQIKSIEEFNFHSKNKGSRVSYCIDCRETYKSEKRNYDKEYYNENKEERLSYYQEWKDNGGNIVRQVNEQNRKAKKKKLLSDLTKTQWNEILDYFNHSCAYCGITEEEHKKIYRQSLHQDHIIPLSKDGAYSNFNIIPACFSCNDRKKTMDVEDFLIHSDKFPINNYIKILDYLIQV